MKKSTAFILVILICIGGILYYFWDKNVTKRKKALEEKLIREEEVRKITHAFFKLRLGNIAIANDKFKSNLKHENGYFGNYNLTIWRKDYSILFDEINDKTFELINLKNEEVSSIKSFLNYHKNGDSLRTEFNKKFVINELKHYEAFFSKIEKHGLDSEQRIAVVTDDDNNIVIAGAGSGKTTTIVGKVNYVIDRYKIPPTEILLISFTNKSAATLAERINIDGVEAKTFHKFGKDVICDVENKQPSIFDELQFKTLLTTYFKELIKDRSYLQKVTTYFTSFLKPEKLQNDFESQGEYIQYLKDQNFKSYKIKEIAYKGKTTYKMEVVKSIEECKIANFLLFNGVDYEYELPYKYDTATSAYRQYKPDFTINPKSETVYLEHFAINKNGKVPNFFAKVDEGQTIEEATKIYTDGMTWKRTLHKSKRTVLIETYSHEMPDGVLFEKLEQRLKTAGVQLCPKTPEEIWRIISEAAKEEVDNFIALFQTFITLMKSNNYRMVDVVNKNEGTPNKLYKQRNALFIEIASPILAKYEGYLLQRKEIDFSDMINKASEYIAKGQFKKKFSYVIIDEFQDISIGRYQLVKAIKESNPECKLFCVGDDWQSIYRFSGSDIALFKYFERFFGYTVKSKIETTYRFHDPLIKLSSEFVLKNPNQAKKDLKGSHLMRSTNSKIVYSFSENNDDTLATKEIFDEILSKRDWEGKEVYVLGRYSFDIDRIKNEPGIFGIDKNTGIISYLHRTEDGGTKRLQAHFMTIHKAKGLEADIVIILNCNSGKHGFPSEMSDDPVLNLLLSEADQFENGEERRLFYVAMTRAKSMVYFVADSSFKSKFIAELEVTDEDAIVKKCPRCKTADLIKRSGTKNGKQWAFYGCTNFMYGCTHQEWV